MNRYYWNKQFKGKLAETERFAYGYTVEIRCEGARNYFFKRKVQYHSLVGCYVVIDKEKYRLDERTNELKPYFI